jgi:hypothetical protein
VGLGEGQGVKASATIDPLCAGTIASVAQRGFEIVKTDDPVAAFTSLIVHLFSFNAARNASMSAVDG